jgi:hypothetical protein
LSLASFSSLVQCSRLVALPTKIRLGWKSLPGTKPSLLRTFVNYDRKNFITMYPGVTLQWLMGRKAKCRYHWGMLR